MSLLLQGKRERLEGVPQAAMMDKLDCSTLSMLARSRSRDCSMGATEGHQNLEVDPQPVEVFLQQRLQSVENSQTTRSRRTLDQLGKQDSLTHS